jgi:hypothetical protein
MSFSSIFIEHFKTQGWSCEVSLPASPQDRATWFFLSLSSSGFTISYLCNYWLTPESVGCDHQICDSAFVCVLHHGSVPGPWQEVHPSLVFQRGFSQVNKTSPSHRCTSEDWNVQLWCAAEILVWNIRDLYILNLNFFHLYLVFWP